MQSRFHPALDLVIMGPIETLRVEPLPTSSEHCPSLAGRQTAQYCSRTRPVSKVKNVERIPESFGHCQYSPGHRVT
jgi:hypothetical protein